MVDAVNSQKSSGFPTGALIGGAAVGAGATYFTKFGKKPIGLEELTTDQFTKTKEKLATAEEKAHGTTIENYLKNKPAAATTPATATTVASTAAPVDNTKFVDNLAKKRFVGINDMQPTSFIRNVDSHKKQIENLENDVKTQQTTMSNLTKDIDTANASLAKARETFSTTLDHEESKISNPIKQRRPEAVVNGEIKMLEAKKNRTTDEETKLTEVKQEKQELLDIAKNNTELTEKKKALDTAEKNLETKRKNGLDCAEQEAKVTGLKEEIYGLEEAVAEDSGHVRMINNASREHAKLDQEAVDAEKKLTEAETEFKKITDVDLKKTKQLEVDELKKEAIRKRAAATDAKELLSNVSIKDPAARQNAIENLIQKHQTKTKGLETSLANETATLRTKSESHLVKKAELELFEEAKAGKTKVSAEAYKAKLGGIQAQVETVAKESGAKVGETAKSIPEAVKTAFEAIKGHLPTKVNGGKIAIGAAIGAAVFALVAGMTGGKKETPEA